MVSKSEIEALEAIGKFGVEHVVYNPKRHWFAGEVISTTGAKVFIKASSKQGAQRKLSKEWSNLLKVHKLLPANLISSVVEPVKQVVKERWLINTYKYLNVRPVSSLRGEERMLAINKAIEWTTKLALATMNNKSVLEHGDFTVNNLLWDTNSKMLFIADWEMMREDGLPMYDLVDLVVSEWLETIRGKMRIGINVQLKKNEMVFLDYLHSINLDEKLLWPLMEKFFQVAAERESALDGIPVEKTVYSRLYLNVKSHR
ncbi:MAG: hypothetical protein UX31_C0004G0007 [Candidatus Nomurabacteria bacterium GW2011_GWA1_46_11]|uniref:Aminoglycoside phosphotransferase domain-containing protein n=2 Tax=Parcubacteria group TaxID=1794811 RepID=A0A1G1YVK3_9BACT|nr:MAG: hypothetical protein UX29_C0003G0021 [Parcubacteria group bacterium GW2011_GWA2_46_10]KKU22278.1 MAG: hypothetical protein UX31_C0004G0007 [Candidatus Nomurabacteria bacterium GW2011_GWA1_46_11]OGY56428.1 MAG: hypothetical protein A2119_02200 [Candidatus Colwellbacteria bacterium GWA2_46_10]